MNGRTLIAESKHFLCSDTHKVTHVHRSTEKYEKIFYPKIQKKIKKRNEHFPFGKYYYHFYFHNGFTDYKYNH